MNQNIDSSFVRSPVKETLETCAFIEMADTSKANNGASVGLQSIAVN